MIRYIVIMTHSGRLLYKREVSLPTAPVVGLNSSPPPKPIDTTMLGAILVAAHSFSLQRTGCSISYIELDDVSLSISFNTTLLCVIVSDLYDGMIFSRLVSSYILNAFTTRFHRDVSSTIILEDTFLSFNSELHDTIKYTIRPVLDYLAIQPGIILALLAGGVSNLFYATRDIDKIGVLANLPRIIDKSSDLFQYGNNMNAVTFKNYDTTLHLYRLDRYNLVIITRNSTPSNEYTNAFTMVVQLLSTLLNTASRFGQ